MKERNKALDAGLNILDIVGKLVLIVVMAFPFFWMISTALKTLGETLLYPPSLLPESPQWSNFAEVFKTIPVGLNGLILKYDIKWGEMAAGTIMSLVPTMCLFAFAQKYMIEGLTAGSVKG